jgi:hypothetical protein
MKDAAVSIDTPGTAGVATTLDDDSGRPVQRARINRNDGDQHYAGNVRDMFHALTAWREQGDTANDGGTQSRNQIERSCREELNRYKNEVSLDMFCEGTDDFSDPLQWWEEKKNVYPTLYELSKRLLSIPATSAPSERLWSLASRIITIRRARLKSTLVSDMMFIKENSMIMNKHFHAITGEQRILPLVYPAGEEEEDDVDEDACDLDVGGA